MDVFSRLASIATIAARVVMDSFIQLKQKNPRFLLIFNQILYFLIIHAHIGFTIKDGCLSVNFSSPSNIAFTISIVFNMIAIGLLMQRPRDWDVNEEPDSASQQHPHIGEIATNRESSLSNMIAIASTLATLASSIVGIALEFATRD